MATLLNSSSRYQLAWWIGDFTFSSEAVNRTWIPILKKGQISWASLLTVRHPWLLPCDWLVSVSVMGQSIWALALLTTLVRDISLKSLLWVWKFFRNTSRSVPKPLFFTSETRRVAVGNLMEWTSDWLGFDPEFDFSLDISSDNLVSMPQHTLLKGVFFGDYFNN